MTSAVGVSRGEGVPKGRRNEQNQLICDSDRGEGVKKYENFADVIYGTPLIEFLSWKSLHAQKQHLKE